MKSIRQVIKKALPASVVTALQAGRDGLRRSSELPLATLHPWRRDSIQKLKVLKDSRRGERCFILGNGPSLRQTDLSRLRTEYTIGMNRIFLAFPEMGFATSYYLAVNDLVIEQSVEDIQRIDAPRFISWRSRRWIPPQDGLHYLHTTYTGACFATHAARRLWEGATVTYVALQLAFHLGFDEVILIGVDHSFVTSGKPNTTVVSEGDDPNHFHPGYFGRGFRWQLPDLETSEQAYRMARQEYERHGRRVIDATIGGKLRVFERREYDSLF